MNQKIEDCIARAAHRILSKAGAPDPVGLSEKIAELSSLLADMETQDEGIASVSAGLEQDVAWDIGRVREAAPPPKLQPAPLPERAIVPADGPDPTSRPAAPRKSSLVLPGDPEFRAPDKTPARPKTISATEVKRRPARGPAREAERQWWDYHDLSEAIQAGTPESVPIEIDTPKGTVKITCHRNVICQTGHRTVILTYKHDSVSATVDGRVTVDLIAKYSFSLFDKELDFGVAMDDPAKGIMAQLRGLYRYRGDGAPAPTTKDPGPLHQGLAFQSDTVKGDLVYGEDPGPQMDKAMRDVARDNNSLAPSGRRF